MLANYEVEMLTGNGGVEEEDCSTRSNQEKKEKKERGKNVHERELRVRVLIGQLCFCCMTLNLLHEHYV